jgi:hypothetical protein
MFCMMNTSAPAASCVSVSVGRVSPVAQNAEQQLGKMQKLSGSTQHTVGAPLQAFHHVCHGDIVQQQITFRYRAAYDDSAVAYRQATPTVLRSGPQLQPLLQLQLHH